MGYEIFLFWTDDKFPDNTNLEILEQYGLGEFLILNFKGLFQG